METTTDELAYADVNRVLMGYLELKFVETWTWRS
jgi:hypothetical protein